MVAKSDKPTVGQNNMMKPKQSRLTTFFARKPSPRDNTKVRVSDTSSDEGVDTSPIRAKAMPPGDEDDVVIPATPEPSVSRIRKERPYSTSKPIRLSFMNSDNFHTRGDPVLHSNEVSNDVPPPPTDINVTAKTTQPGTYIKDDIPPKPTNDNPGVVDGDGAVGGVVQRPVGVLTVDKNCEFVRGGHCLVHGGVKTKKFKGGYKMAVGRRGVPVKRYQRSYVCDRKGEGLLQTRLSFIKTTPKLSGTENALQLYDCTSKEGQHGISTNTE